MANTHSTLSALFTDIAGAIREVDGSTDNIVADTFPDKIRNLSSGTLYQEVANILIRGSANKLNDVDWSYALLGTGSGNRTVQAKNNANIDLIIVEYDMATIWIKTYIISPGKFMVEFTVREDGTHETYFEELTDSTTTNIVFGRDTVAPTTLATILCSGSSLQYSQSTNVTLNNQSTTKKGTPATRIVALSRVAV